MPAHKRPATNHGAAGRPLKRPRPQPQSQRRPASALRPTRSSSNREVIYISSASPAASQDLRRAEQKAPSGGIQPVDSFQDIVVNSVEHAPEGHNGRAGIEHYVYLMKRYAASYTTVSIDFNAYKHAVPPNAPPGDPLPDPVPRIPDLGLPDPQYNYKKLPDHFQEYTQPIYKAKTYNPLIPLAIIRLAEKNLTFIDFSSDLAHVPNVGPQTLPPQFPPIGEGESMPFLDMATTWVGMMGDQIITLLFLPNYYMDRRHAIGFYTRKSPSGRFCSLICTPCTTPELRAAGLIEFTAVDVNTSTSCVQDDDIGGEDAQVQWDDVEVGVKDGEWLYPTLAEDLVRWEDAEDVVGWEWVVRLRITLRKSAEDSEDAKKMDGGFWGETRWE